MWISAKAWIDPILFSAVHTYDPESFTVTFSIIRKLRPASSTLYPGHEEQENINASVYVLISMCVCLCVPTSVYVTLRPTCIGTIINSPGDNRGWGGVGVAGEGQVLPHSQCHVTRQLLKLWPHVNRQLDFVMCRTYCIHSHTGENTCIRELKKGTVRA